MTQQSDKRGRQDAPGKLPHDWTEDFGHENGQYPNRCIVCEALFYGYKRRHVCKVCVRHKDPEAAPSATQRTFEDWWISASFDTMDPKTMAQRGWDAALKNTAAQASTPKHPDEVQRPQGPEYRAMASADSLPVAAVHAQDEFSGGGLEFCGYDQRREDDPSNISGGETDSAPSSIVPTDDQLSKLFAAYRVFVQRSAPAKDQAELAKRERWAWEHVFGSATSATQPTKAPVPVAWRREWEGDSSDLNHWLYVEDASERDEPVDRWEPLYASEAPPLSAEEAKANFERMLAAIERTAKP